uniref:Uncharacterized protein n=1 Tax=Arundo donax TaxID=35708 RepID=A0A0A8YKR2_ARUDO
MVQFGSRC